ncbi:unnamed protein product [Rhizoctonia solani]|uniref:Protein kinase domain-containing protein n=1 Tax=Rhizoctonia solani TaxID=456999 RepID=A0A8H3DBA8_9AGAM|nr:unnamed protein product [Rhizoctonia solani]
MNSPLDATIPFNVPGSVPNTNRTGSWHRMSLFDSTRGEIGLIASVFKLLGTPTETTWPEFNALPAASGLIFNPMPPKPLRPLLPNLIPGENPTTLAEDPDWIQDRENVVELIQGLVRYPPRSRTSASDLLRHSYFHQGSPIILPPGYIDADCERPPQVESNSLAAFISQLIATSNDEDSNPLE